MHHCAGGLWLQGHTARASLLCSVGKIFHCVHYLSSGLRIYNIFCVTKHTIKRNKNTVHKSARECSQQISVSQSVSCNFTSPNTDVRQTQHNLFPLAAIQYTIDTNTELAHNRTLNFTRTIRNIKITDQAIREAADPHTTLRLLYGAPTAPARQTPGMSPHSRNLNLK